MNNILKFETDAVPLSYRAAWLGLSAALGAHTREEQHSVLLNASTIAQANAAEPLARRTLQLVGLSLLVAECMTRQPHDAGLN